MWSGLCVLSHGETQAWGVEKGRQEHLEGNPLMFLRQLCLDLTVRRGNLTAHPPPPSPCVYLLLGCFRTYLIKTKLRKQIPPQFC